MQHQTAEHLTHDNVTSYVTLPYRIQWQQCTHYFRYWLNSLLLFRFLFWQTELDKIIRWLFIYFRFAMLSSIFDLRFNGIFCFEIQCCYMYMLYCFNKWYFTDLKTIALSFFVSSPLILDASKKLASTWAHVVKGCFEYLTWHWMFKKEKKGQQNNE